MPSENESFASYVRRNRISAGFKQDILAKRAGISQSYVSGIERGINVEVDPKFVIAIAEALNLDTDEALRIASADIGYAPQEPQDVEYVTDPDEKQLLSSYRGVVSDCGKRYARDMIEAMRRSDHEESLGGSSALRND